MSLQDYWRVIRKRRWVIIPVFALIFLATVIYSYFQPFMYEATASVQYTEQKSTAMLLTELVSSPIGDTMLSQAKVASSWSVMEIAAKNLGYVTPEMSTDESQRIISGIQKSVKTDIEKDTNFIRITVQDSAPKQTSTLANAVAVAYQEYNRIEKSKAVTQLRQTIENRLSQTKQKLDRTEEDLRAFKEQNPEVTGGANTAFNKFEDMKKQRELLMGKYTDKHPEVIKIGNLIETYRQELARYPDKELSFSRFSREAALYNTIYGELKQQLERAWLNEAEKTSDVSIVNIAAMPLLPVSPNKAKNQIIGIMLGLVVGIVMAFVVEHLDTSIATIEEIEALLKIPVVGVIPFLSKGSLPTGKKSDKSDLLSWLLGGPSTQSSTKGVQAKGENILGEHAGSIRSQLILNYSPTSPISESYRTLRTNLIRDVFKPPEGAPPTAENIASGENNSQQMLLASGKKGKIIIVTSTGPEEGKTITAINLSITMAQKGELVLLVDGDMRKSIIHKVLGLEKDPGLSDVLMGTTNSESVIHNITDALIGGLNWDSIVKAPGIDNLHIMTAGTAVPNPSELLSSPQADSLFRKLKEQYNYIIWDCPPILPVTDVLIIGPKSEILTLVYRAGRTAKAALLRATEQMTAAHIKIKGLILNHITPEIEVSPTYYYQYYRDYSPKGEK